jgi:hypothetical protein
MHHLGSSDTAARRSCQLVRLWAGAGDDADDEDAVSANSLLKGRHRRFLRALAGKSVLWGSETGYVRVDDVRTVSG